MKVLMLAILLTSSLAVQAGPSSEVAWTPEQLTQLKKADAAQGAKLAQEKGCVSCHGEKGVSTMPETPSIAGQLTTYLYKQMQDYAKKHRTNDMMTAALNGLNEQDMANLAKYFNSLSRPTASKAGSKLDKAETLVGQGDGKRLLPPCAVCHGSSGAGEIIDNPALAGQQASYLVKTLTDYKENRRQNDIYSRMRNIAQQLNIEEIKQLADYYQGQ